MADFQENKSDAVEAADARLPHQTLAARRRILLGSVGAAPVIMTFASPALAGSCGGRAVVTPSMATSANLSGKNKTVYANGRSPGYWKTHTPWNNGYSTTQKFGDIFGLPPGGEIKATHTLLDVISPNTYGTTGINGSGTTVPFARACVSSLLNAAAGFYNDPTVGNWLSPATVIAMWKGGMSGGWLVPNTNVTWNTATIQAYLINTWDTAYNCTC